MPKMEYRRFKDGCGKWDLRLWTGLPRENLVGGGNFKNFQRFLLENGFILGKIYKNYLITNKQNADCSRHPKFKRK